MDEICGAFGAGFNLAVTPEQRARAQFRKLRPDIPNPDDYLEAAQWYNKVILLMIKCSLDWHYMYL